MIFALKSSYLTYARLTRAWGLGFCGVICGRGREAVRGGAVEQDSVKGGSVF